MGSNLGHRLGEVVTTSLENSAERMLDNWIYQTRDAFKYWEFDIVECLSGDLIVIHDRTLPNKNRVIDFTIVEIKELYPEILELNELFDLFFAYDQQKLGGADLSKPILCEVKRLYTNTGRRNLIEAIKGARIKLNFKVEIHCISFDNFKIKHFKKSFPKDEREFWGLVFKADKINMLKVGKHSKDLFKNPKFKNTPAGSFEIEYMEKGNIFKRFWKFIRDLF
jgi:hypothetical protein